MNDDLPGGPSADDIVLALAASPDFARDGLCFAACQSGLYRSQDGGLSWHSAYDSLGLSEPLATTAVAVAPEVSAAHTVVAGARGGFLLSTDSGATWQAFLLPPPAPNITTLVFSPDYAADGQIFAGTLEDGVFRSTDRGRHWAASNFGLLDLNIYSLAVSPDFANDESLVAGAESGVFHSTNGGRSWREMDFPSKWAPVLSLAYSPNYAVDGCLLAGTEANGLLRSLDRGQSWAHLGQGRLAAAINAILPVVPPSGGLELLAALPEAVLVSRDGGQTWVNWKDGRRLSATISAVAAPCGLGQHAPLLVGLADGHKLRL